MHLHTITLSNGVILSFTPHGGNLVSWIPVGMGEQLFLSTGAQAVNYQAIHAGVPIMFPQFSNLGPLAHHGFARLMDWSWVNQDQAVHDNQLVLELSSNDETRAMWPHDFTLHYTIKAQGNSLTLSLKVINTGSSSFNFTSALHTYFAVSSCKNFRLEGLQMSPYLDNCQDRNEFMDGDESLVVKGEVDRIYLAPTPALRIVDQDRIVDIDKRGFADVVIWNPGETVTRYPDLGRDDEDRFLCIEAAAIKQAIFLDGGEEWVGVQEINVSSLG